MKKKIMSLIALSLVGTMMVTSLTGCGLQTKATDITVDDGDTIIVDQEDMETEETEPETDVADTEDTNSDEITGEEVVGDDTEANDFMGAEDENIVLYAEIAEYGEYCSQEDQTFEPVNNTFTASDNLPIYNVEGIEVGYIKKDATITFTGYASNAWARFENPIAGTDYDYLYGFKEYADVPNTNQITINPSDIEQKVIDDLKHIDINPPTIVDSPTSDMEVFEFRMDSVYEDADDFDFWYSKNLRYDTTILYEYMTYCIECEEDTDGWITCRLYYKDDLPDGARDTY